MSLAPSSKSATSDRIRLRESPKMIVKIPNPATAHNSVGPDRPRSGRCASNTAITAAPAPGAVRIRPSPQGPV